MGSLSICTVLLGSPGSRRGCLGAGRTIEVTSVKNILFEGGESWFLTEGFGPGGVVREPGEQEFTVRKVQ